MMPAELSDADILELTSNPIEEIRAKLAAKVAVQLTEEALSPAEREIAHDILREMALDVSIVVRKVLSENLRHARDLPGDIALSLARDVESVALPMLESSPVFSEADLVELVRIGTAAKQVAVARRDHVSESVSYALIEMHNSDAVVALMANDGAVIGERGFTRSLELYGDNDAVKSAMTHRDYLPPAIAERLVTMVSEQLQKHLMLNHNLPADVVTDLVLDSREQAVLSYAGPGADPRLTAKLVAQLYGHGRLTSSLVLRALCLGDMDFCEHAFSHLAVVPLEHARKLIYDPGPLGFEAIYERAGMPPALFPIFKLAIEVHDELAFDFEVDSRDQFCARMIEHVREDGKRFSDSDRDYLMKTLSRITKAA